MDACCMSRVSSATDCTCFPAIAIPRGSDTCIRRKNEEYHKTQLTEQHPWTGHAQRDSDGFSKNRGWLNGLRGV
jgi:hypothetical protein